MPVAKLYVTSAIVYLAGCRGQSLNLPARMSDTETKMNSSESSHGPSKVADDSSKPLPVKEEIKSFLKNILFLAVAFCFLRGTIIEAFKIPSGSMIPTLKIGDRLLVSKLSYGLRILGVRSTLFRWSTPSRGDIVVFTRDDEPLTVEDESSVNIIKRVVGLPGETVEVRERKVFINGVEIEEKYAHWGAGGLPEGDFKPQTIPADHVFLLGDNRDHSKDSRFWAYPFLHVKNIKGRALIIYWSFDGLSRIGKIIR
jgi:signal peptidase I